MSGKFNSETGLSWSNGYNSGLTYSDSLWRNLSPTGSGAAATAIASGRKTYNASIGMDIYFKPLKSIAEKAKELGKSAGLVTSVPFTHATPASFASHNVHRDNYEEIAREMIKSNIDVIFGCGHPEFDDNGNRIDSQDYKYVGGKEFWKSFISNKKYGRRLITKLSEFEKLLMNPTEDKLLGLPQVHTTLQAGREGDVNASPNKVPFNKSIPSLKLMTKTALSSLNQNPRGFFLMVEGGAVDWAAHTNHSGRMIEELNSFNKAVESVVKWVETNSNWDETLLIVTSDHETGYLTGVNGF
ncbi:MAG: alkaline phosphatase, partial [Candidatus Kapaibacterium sp.]